MMKYLTLLAFFGISTLSLLAGGPWLEQKKSAFFQTQFTLPLGSYNRLFLDNVKDLQLNSKIIDAHWQQYLEYGLSNRLNLITSLPIKYVSSKNELGDYKLFGFSNILLGLKIQIHKKKWVSAIRIDYAINATQQDLSAGLSTGYPANYADLNYYFGRGFSKGWYAYSNIGIRKFFIHYSDGWTAYLEVGKSLKHKIWLAAVVSSLQSFHNSNLTVFSTLYQTGLYPNNQEYIAYGLKFSKEYNDFGFNLSTYGALAGNYVAHLATLNIGFFWKLNFSKNN